MDGQGVLQEADINAAVGVKEASNDGVLVQATLNLSLNQRMLHLFVLLDNLLNLVDNALESPLGKVSGHLHALALAVQLHFLDILEELRELSQGHLALGKTIKHFLGEVAIHAVFLKIGHCFNFSGKFSEDARHKGRHVLLLEVALQDLQAGAVIAFRL